MIFTHFQYRQIIVRLSMVVVIRQGQLEALISQIQVSNALKQTHKIRHEAAIMQKSIYLKHRVVSLPPPPPPTICYVIQDKYTL